MNRGEGTPPATKSGRKVKRPAHFDDSPETASPGKVKKEVAPESVKKSARRTLALAGTPPSAKNGSDSESGEVALGKKSARKTLAKNGSREESPEPEVKKAAPASARKTLLKSAVQNSSAEAGTPKKTPAKKVDPEPEASEAAGPGLSRTGRKIKVPAHLKEFEDVVVPAVTGRKSVAPKKDEQEAVPKSATKTKTIVRQLATEHEEEKPEPKTPAKTKQARKAAEEEEEEAKPVTKTPGRARSVARKTAEEEEDAKPAPRARGRSVARKASVDESTPFEEKPTPKTYGRARSVARQTEDEDKAKSPVKPVEAPKTPGRAKSVSRRFANADDEEEVPKPAPKTPGRAKSMAARKPSVDEPAQPTKTPSRRAKSIAPQSKPDEEVDPLALPEEPPKPESPPKKQPAKTPSKARAKSIARDPSPEPAQKSDPSEPAPTSRSGRKIKPKKYFGEFEQDESVPAVVPAAKVLAASPVKSPKVIAASPVRSPQQQIVKKGSPYAPKKDLPAASPVTKTTTSPVKRLSVPEKKSPAAVVPSKKAKKDSADGDDGFKISPATEERQITKRNVNDHHHQQQVATKPESPKVVAPSSPAVAGKSVSPPKKAKLESPKIVPSEPEIIAEHDPLASSSSGSIITTTTSSSSNSCVTITESSEASTPPAPPKEVEDKPKRGRKTLPAAPASEDTAEVQKTKTPGRKTMAPTVVAAAAPLEEPGSSRSGRKIKPKKFFDDGEPTVKAKPEVATPAGRGGKRKTIVIPREEKEEGEEEEEEEKKEEKEEKKEEPIESVSREEIMAIVGDFGEVPEPVDADDAAAAPAEAEPINGTTEETLDTAATDLPTPTTDDTTAAEADQPVAAAAAAVDSTEEQAAAVEPEPQDAPTGQYDEVAETSAGNFPETPIEQTPPLESTTEETNPEPTTAPTVPDDPVASAEAEPAPAEQSASSAFSEALLVEEESTAAAAGVGSAEGGPTVEEKMEELFESVEFLEESSARLSDVTAAAAAVADGITADVLEQELGEVMGEEGVAPVEEPVQGDETEDLDKTEPPSAMDEPTLESVQQQEEEEEEDLNKTEPPAALNETAEDVGQNQEEELLATSMPDEVDEFFAENDRSQESITVLPETPKQKPGLEQEDLDLIGKLPEPQQSSSNTVAFVEIPTPATPKTPESKPAIGKDDYSPDKPDAQEQASEPHELQKQQTPPEIIEIFDSPVVATAVEPANQDSTSTPVGPSSSKLTVKERLIQNSRKRSLSASDADLSTKKNVTFHSPANSTILVDTLDERLKKSLKADSKSKVGRKRSLSEHKETDPAGPKPSKISKLPNFKNIHQNQFNRMESIAEYHNRKVQRAKEILTNSASKSPAKNALVRGATPQKSTPHSGQKNGSSVATQLKFSAGPKPASASHTTTASSSSAATSSTAATSVKPLLSDEARQEKRQQQFKAAFKPKAALDSGKSHQDSPDGARRVVEQSRHKQHQILKGVRTNKRFELLMKFRDAAQD